MKRPKLLLLDEPLAALDKKLREAYPVRAHQYPAAPGVTFIVVTTTREEAHDALGTRLGVMNHGRIVQVGSPRTSTSPRPTASWRDFIGSVNMFEGKGEREGAGGRADSRARNSAGTVRAERTRCELYARRHRLDRDTPGEDQHQPPPAGCGGRESGAARCARSPTWGICRSTWADRVGQDAARHAAQYAPRR